MNRYRKLDTTEDRQRAFRKTAGDEAPEFDMVELEREYKAWSWFLRNCDDFPFVLNALPPGMDFNRHFWEEWYVLQGKVHHHILYTENPGDYDEIFQAPETDDIHPPETLGKSWYVVDDEDPRPVLLRTGDLFPSLWVERPGRTVYRWLPKPHPQSDEVLVEIKACGICGTDLHFFRDWPEKKPTPLGHELSGRVMEVGSAVRHLKIGDDVVVQNHIACGTCRACLNGRPSKCTSIRSYMDDQAGMGRYLCVPGEMVIPYAGLDYAEATLAEPLTVSLDLIDRAGIQIGDSVLVVGPGIIGLGCVALAAEKGAERVIAAGRGAGKGRGGFRLEMAKEIGADDIVDTSSPDWKTLLTGKYPCRFDKIIVTAPPAAIPDFLNLLSFGGDLIYDGISFTDDTISFSANDLHFNKNSIISSHAIPNWGFPLALDLLKTGKWHLQELLTHKYPFRHAEQAIQVHDDYHTPCIKSVVIME